MTTKTTTTQTLTATEAPIEEAKKVRLSVARWLDAASDWSIGFRDLPEVVMMTAYANHSEDGDEPVLQVSFRGLHASVICRSRTAAFSAASPVSLHIDLVAYIGREIE